MKAMSICDDHTEISVIRVSGVQSIWPVMEAADCWGKLGAFQTQSNPAGIMSIPESTLLHARMLKH